VLGCVPGWAVYWAGMCFACCDDVIVWCLPTLLKALCVGKGELQSVLCGVLLRALWMRCVCALLWLIAAISTLLHITLSTHPSIHPSTHPPTRLENTLNYGMERVWALGTVKGSNNVAFGFDEVG